jgi:hypothetical protein
MTSGGAAVFQNTRMRQAAARSSNRARAPACGAGRPSVMAARMRGISSWSAIMKDTVTDSRTRKLPQLLLTAAMAPTPHRTEAAT